MNARPAVASRAQRWSLVSVEVDAVVGARDAVLERHFDATEIVALSRRHGRSTAGWLAAKRAVIALLRASSRSVDAGPLEERDVVLRYGAEGRPWLRRAGELSFEGCSCTTQPFRIAISISHSRKRAWGLAVLDEASVGRAGDQAAARKGG